MIKSLISIRLRALFGSLLGKKKDGTRAMSGKGRIVGMAAIMLFLAAVFFLFFFVLAFASAAIMIPLGLDKLYFSIFIILSFSVVFILSIFETKSELFECKDNELLLSMPIKPRHIVLSRIFTVLIYNFAEQMIVIIPCVIAYAVFGGGARGIFGALLLSLFLPLLATALASGVGYLVALVMKRIKKNSLVTVLISLVFLALYFVGYNYFLTGMEALEDPNVDLSGLTNSLGVLGYIGSAALFHPVWTPVVILVSLAIAIGAYLIISASYVSIVTDNKGRKRTVYKTKKAERKSAFSAMVGKDLRRFLTSPTYILNGALGLVLMLVAAVFLLFRPDMIASVSLELGVADGAGFSASMVLSALTLILSMTYISSAALSYEGHSLWIIKTMPISARCVLFAKAMPHIIVSLPPALVSAVLAMIAVGAPPAYIPFFILTPASMCVLGAFLGIFFNTAFPKFNYENEAQPIKQSASSTLTMLTFMLYGFVTLVVNFVVSVFVSPLLASAAVLILTLLLAGLFMWLVAGPSARKYDTFCA